MNKNYTRITPKQAMQMIQSEEVILLDVRTYPEHCHMHIEGSMLIPNDQIDRSVLNKISDLDSKILVYCRSGHRSLEAADKLSSLGYTNVYECGGIVDWPYKDMIVIGGDY